MEQFKRIDKILLKSQDKTWESDILCWFEHLKQELKFPIEVTGIEDFRWEEIYIFNPQYSDEYNKKKLTQPSYTDHYILKNICMGEGTNWMLSPHDDICAMVIRKKDKKEFVLGLSELESVNKSDSSYQKLDDYSVFFYNYR